VQIGTQKEFEILAKFDHTLKEVCQIIHTIKSGFSARFSIVLRIFQKLFGTEC